jgi:bifunctional DNA-binding transcriptional regulator/antitoxin component of YhaV-PrlF toxin-antitoxin module
MVEEDHELGYFVQLPKKLLKDMGWNVGDNIRWVDNKDGSFTLEKVK